MRPLLELLEGLRVIDFAQRDAATLEEFERYLRQWIQKQHQQLTIGYLAFHGEPGKLVVGDTSYALEDLGELLEDKLEGRILHFASCRTLKVSPSRLDDLRRRTGARAVCGYTRDVDWIESAAFDLNLIDAITRFSRISAGFRYLAKHHDGMCTRLGFRAVWANGSIGIPETRDREP